MTMAWAAAALLLGGALAHAASPAPAAPAADQDAPNPRVLVKTSMGNFVIELYPQRAPLTVRTFLQYVHEGQYTNTLFHRVIANFVIQGGGHDATTYKLKPIHGYVPNESGNGLQNKRGWVGLARAAGPHTGNCQFYVNLVDNPELDPLPTRWGYAVFGKVVEGMDVVDRIGVVPTGAFGPFKANAPLKPVVIESITEMAPGAVAGTGAGSASPAPATPASATPPVQSPN
jgi:cyclophilin family peptidyl-prolyl cis-trans isomerase